MATSKKQANKDSAFEKKSSSSKGSSAKKSNSSYTKETRFEIVALCLIALCIYFLVCVYSPYGGKVGAAISKFILGFFGTPGYVFPILTVVLLVWSMWMTSRKGRALKSILSYLALIDISAIFQLIFMKSASLKLAYSLCGVSHKAGGGWIGAVITGILDVFGTAGSYIILFCILFILIIVIFELSIARMFEAVTTYIGEYKEDVETERAIRNEERAIKAEERSQRANEKALEKAIKAEEKAMRAEEKALKAEAKKKAKEEAVEDNIGGFEDRDIIFNLPEDDRFEEFGDPEIKLYDDVTSGSEHEEPSDEEKAAKRIPDDEKESIHREIEEEIEGVEGDRNTLIEYTYPSVDLLAKPAIPVNTSNVQDELRTNARQLIDTLHSFKVDASVVEISQGPTITRYEIEPAEGVRVSQITGLSKDIGLRFKADKGVMVAPVPGKSTIGIEIENKNPSTVTLREVIESDEFKNHKSKLAVALGKDVSGKPIIMDLAKMPHLLVAGATGAGKSVCINTLVISLLYKADPNEVKLVMIDPKQVELGVYNGIPHLLIPVVKDPKKATGALSWAVQEMTERYSMFERNNVRNIKGYNDLMEKNGTPENKMPSIVIIIDEFADLMMVAPADVENYVCRIAQLARAAGMHLVIATQRPVVKFITGNIKANVPSRISFMVASVRDSQTILDMGGAEKLIGKGDMLYMPVGETTPSRMQCAFVSDDDVKSVVDFISNGVEAAYDPNVIEQIEKDEGEYEPDGEDPGEADELLPDAIDMAVTSGQISTSLLQRRFRIGYNRAGSIIDQMEARGIISGLDGNKPRQVLITREQYNEMLMK